jgi:hypothetical protein
VGALGALALSGLAVVVGELAQLFVDGQAVGLLATLGVEGAPLTAGPLSALGLGPLLGPHVAFAGGVGAAAYAGRKGTIDTRFRYHQAKQIRRPLYDHPWALAVGGIFGLVGVGLAAVGSLLPLDPVAFAVVVSGLLARLAVGYPLFGRFERTGILDMSPFRAGAYWGDGGHETSEGIAGRHVVEPWQPSYYEPLAVLGVGVVGGVLAAAIALAFESVLLPFGLALASLFGVVGGLRVSGYPVPVTHHIALPAAIGALAVGGTLPVGLLVGTAFGVTGAMLGELLQRVVYAHGDTHVDPGFGALLVASILVAILVFAGVFDASAVPYL